MGITGYYRIFIKKNSMFAFPITYLHKKRVKFIWSHKCQESFNQLKERLTTAPILKVDEPYKDFIVYIDSSKEGLGGMLSQEQNVIAYESINLKDHEHNYVMHDLELTYLIHALKIWCHYLIGRKLLILTDNISVKYLLNQQELNARKARWLAFLSEFEFEIKHIKGKENKVADALNRRTRGIYEIIVRKLDNNLKDKIIFGSTTDEEYVKIKEKLMTSGKELNKEDFSINNEGILKFKNIIYIPDSMDLKFLIFNEIHKNPYSSHPGY
jgi:hypothetical protein